MTQRRRFCSDKEGLRLATLAADMVAAARARGFFVGGVEFTPDGRVVLLDVSTTARASTPGVGGDDALRAWETGADAGHS